MPLPNYYLYLRGLRQVDHTVFCVTKGQKTYFDPKTGHKMPYSSGQQVKHSIIDELVSVMDEVRAPITFNWTLSTKDGKRKAEQEEPWSPCDPTYADQLIGGWMKASKDGKDGGVIKRRSPLSISAMRTLHPTLARISEEEATFDRRDKPEQHKIRVVDSSGKEISQQEFLDYMKSENRNIPMSKWIPSDQVGPRASGLFIYDVAIDFRALFSVSLNISEPELSVEKIASLKQAGWKESADKTRLICPEERRREIITALAHSLIYWRITSNQSRTYSPQNTLAVAISHNANKLGASIRADLSEESDYKRAEPILEAIEGVKVYTALTAKAHIPGVIANRDALEQAETDLAAILSGYNYDA